MKNKTDTQTHSHSGKKIMGLVIVLLAAMALSSSALKVRAEGPSCEVDTGKRLSIDVTDAMPQGGIINLNSSLDVTASHLFISDQVFLLSALAFNLLLAVFFVAHRNRWIKTARTIGILWLLLAIPLTFVFAHYLAEGRGPEVLVPLALVLLYMLVEFLLDFVFKVDFRRSWKTHVPYIMLEYVALFSLIRIAFSINRSWGYLVSITFWILLASLIYLFSDKLRTRKRQASEG